MVVSPLWRGPGNTHGFLLDGESYRLGQATAQTLTEPAVSGVRITTSSHYSVACGRWSLVSSQALFLAKQLIWLPC